MQNATRLCVGGMLLFLGAASPALAQVTMLYADEFANLPAGAAVHPPDSAPSALVVSGPVSNGATAPSINLDKLLGEQSSAPTTRHQSTGCWSRHRAGDSPNSRLNARLNASLDP